MEETKITTIATQLELIPIEPVEDTTESLSSEFVCPDCGSGRETILISGRCKTCLVCGWSLCSL